MNGAPIQGATNSTHQVPTGLTAGTYKRIAGRGETWATESGERVTPDQLPALRAARLGETLRGIVLRRRSGGREQWLRISAAPLVFDGRRVGAVASMSDLTAVKHAEQALRESERRLRAMFEDAAVGIVEVDEDDRFVAVNARICAMLGYRREELLGRTLHEITAPEDAARTRDLNARGHSGELRVFDYEKRYLRRDGSRLWVHVNVSVVRDDGGRFMRAIGTVEDITERKRAEQALQDANERLREADRRKDEFLGMLSHELRNPLAPVRNSLYILDRAEPGSAQARRAREVASRQISHMTRLVDDLLDVTRIARGKIELRRGDVDLAALARRAAEDHRSLMTARGLELAVEVPRDPVTIHGDETRLAQVLGNLLHNASKFTPGGGRVAVSLRIEGGAAVVHVRDTGAGMTAATLRTIFEPFTQGEQTLARSEGGLGLGLALVKGLVELHGGSVAATSAGPGLGTDFAVTLPLATHHAARSRATPTHRAAHDQARRVLVIDDNRDAADSLAELVAMLGHRVEVAYDAYEGLARTANGLPDVVLCDIGLPGMDGYEFARQLRARAGAADGVRLVAVSGYAQPEDVARAVEAGFDAHVAKPPDPERLAALCG